MSIAQSTTSKDDSHEKVESEKLNIEIHPLLIDVIVRKIFSFLSLNEILQCRSVCKSWHCEGANRMAKKGMHCVIKDASILKRFYDMTKNFNFKFEKITFGGFNIDCSDANRLFEICGSTIRSLCLLQVSVTSAQFASMLIHLPMLEVLEISELPKEVMKNAIFTVEIDRPELQLRKLILHLEYTCATYDRRFLGDLFQCAKNLSSLDIRSNYDSQSAERTIIRTFIREGTPSKLVELKLSSVDDSVLQLLDAHLKTSCLKTFSIGNKVFYDLSKKFFTNFLYAHNETWEKIKFGIISCPHILKLPKMKRLRFLSIGTNFPKFRNENLSFGVLDWGSLFENLVTLHLYDTVSKVNGERQFNLDEMFPVISTSVPTVKNLELPPELTCDVLRRIGETFPNVLKLNVRHQPCEVLSQLWLTWPLMRTLAISTFAYEESWLSIDSILTGVSEESLKNLSFGQHDDVESLRTRPSICLLQQLRHLLIYDGRRLGEWESCTSNPEITNATAVLSLSKLKELVCLNIPRNLNQITEDVIQDLCNIHGLWEVECPISTYLVKYEWQARISSLNLYLWDSFPDY